MDPYSILIAPNAFKNSLDAVKAGQAIQKGLLASKLSAETTIIPIADGGDGMLEVLMTQFQGNVKYYEVQGPLGQEISAPVGWINEGKTAVIELAAASGIRLIPSQKLDPMRASTYGTGQLILKALDEGAGEIILGVGGSATVDGGAGIVQALGGRLLDDDDREIAPGGHGIGQIQSIDISGCDERITPGIIKVACDVNTPLKDAAAVFGPQKGADQKMVHNLEINLRHYAGMIKENLHTEIWQKEKCGAAGGASAGLYAFFNAELLNGTSFLLGRSGFAGALQSASLVFTAEGGLDAQTLSGKGPFYVAEEARKQQKPVIMLAGTVADDFWGKGEQLFTGVFSIAQGPGTLESAMNNTEGNLFRTAHQIGNLLALELKGNKG